MSRRQADQKYELTKKIGEGAFGAVFSAKVKTTKQKVVAIKMTETEKSKREMYMLEKIKTSGIKSKFIAGHSDSFERGPMIFIVMELMKTTLWEVIDGEDGMFPLHAIRVVSKQILLGLSALHSMGIVHNDLKPDNVMLVDHEKYPYQVKIIDFGGAVHEDFEEGATRYMQSQAYIAPESNINYIVGPKSDMWAHAVILLDMILKKMFFEAYSPPEATYQHYQLMGNPSLKFRKMMKDRLMEHFTSKVVPIFDDKEKAKKRKDSQPETIDDIHNHLLGEGRDEKDVKGLDGYLRRMLTWDPNDRISVDDGLKCEWLNPDTFEDQKYAREAKGYFRKARLELPSRKRKIDKEDDKENKRPAN